MDEKDVRRIVAATLAAGVMARDERTYESLSENTVDAIDLYRHVLADLEESEGLDPCQQT